MHMYTQLLVHLLALSPCLALKLAANWDTSTRVSFVYLPRVHIASLQFLGARPSNSERLVKLFAKDETGHNRPVCTTVAPHQVGRLLETPRQAARFVSLLPFRRLPSLGGQDGSARVEQWTNLHTFLTAV